MGTQNSVLVETPQDVVPGGSVPQAAQDHRDHQVAVGQQLVAPASSQRNVEVIAKPAGEADVPATPELTRIRGEIRLVEIEHQVDAHQLRDSAGDVGVAGKIAVNLHGEQDRPKNNIGPGDVTCAEVDRIDRSGDSVSNRDFLEQSPKDEECSLRDLLVVDRAFLEDSRQQFRCSLNRAGDQLREVGDE